MLYIFSEGEYDDYDSCADILQHDTIFSDKYFKLLVKEYLSIVKKKIIKYHDSETNEYMFTDYKQSPHFLKWLINEKGFKTVETRHPINLDVCEISRKDYDENDPAVTVTTETYI